MDDDEAVDTTPPEPTAPKQTKIKGPKAPRESKGGSGLGSEFKRAELRRKLLLAFNGLAQFWGVADRYAEDDFDAMAESILDVVNLLPPVGRILLRFVGVFGAIGDVLTKTSELWSLRQRFRPKAPPAPTTTATQSTVVNGGHKSIFDR